MKIIKKFPFSDCEISIQQIDRTELKQDIRDSYVGKEQSHIGNPYVRYTYRSNTQTYETHGKLVSHLKQSLDMRRRDIFVIQIWLDRECLENIFINPGEVGPFSRDSDLMILDENEEKELQNRISALLDEPTNKIFAERQLRWIKEEPWTQIYGLTPEEAVLKLEELGW